MDSIIWGNNHVCWEKQACNDVNYSISLLMLARWQHADKLSRKPENALSCHHDEPTSEDVGKMLEVCLQCKSLHETV